MDWLKKNKTYVAAAVAALVAANGILKLVDDSIVSQLLALLGAVGLYLLPPPGSGPTPPTPPGSGGAGGDPIGRALWGTCLAALLLLSPALAVAQTPAGPVQYTSCLPWRQKVEKQLELIRRQGDKAPQTDPAMLQALQRIGDQNAQILALLQHQQAAPAPAPSLPYLLPPVPGWTQPPQVPIPQPGLPQAPIAQPGLPQAPIAQPGAPQIQIQQPGAPQIKIALPGQPQIHIGPAPGAPAVPIPAPPSGQSPGPAAPIPQPAAPQLPPPVMQPPTAGGPPTGYQRYTQQPQVQRAISRPVQ